MWDRLATVGVLAAGFTLASLGDSTQPSVDERVREHIRNRIEAADPVARDIVDHQPIRARAAVSHFYERRIFKAAWSRDGQPILAADGLIAAIKAAEHEGLQPDEYHRATLERGLSQLHTAGTPDRADVEALATLDLLLTDAFLVLGTHLRDGRANPEPLYLDRHVPPRGRELIDALESALATNAVGRTLNELLPPQPGYTELKEALAHYRELVGRGGWAPVPRGRTLRLGDEDARVRALRHRLAITGDANAAESDQGTLFDEDLDHAVRQFQQRHGLHVDGVMGRETREALNVPARQRAREIRLNLDRWRWLPQDLGARHILVNIAGFELELVEDQQPVMRMKTIVGRRYRRTPVFTSAMTYLVINPYWHVPRSIATQDLLPLIRQDPTYLARQGITVLHDVDGRFVPVDPTTIDWSTVTPEQFPFHLRQDPGPPNALGRVKFMFPNRFNVYLHDTPAQELFERTTRSFSSGCIRIERPIELARYVLRGDATWTPQALEMALQTRMDYSIRIPQPIPIHLVYWTASVDERGLQFRRDLYGRDDALRVALAAPLPNS